MENRRRLQARDHGLTADTQDQGDAMRGKLAVVAVTLFVFASALAADERMDVRRDAVVQAVEKVAGAVVNISTEKLVQRNLFGDMGPFADPMGMFSRPEIAHSLGSGGIFTPDGYVFTNAHVVNRASKIMVTFSDGSQHPAELVNVDLTNDVAVIKIEADKPLPYLTLGRSDDLMVGERAIAVGNPFGLSNTVTQGVISATHRDVVVEDRVLFKDFLQTDALINPGNSGGPLLNVLGEVIGVNSAMRADAQGIGFAIPVDRVKRSLAALLDFQKMRRMKLGFEIEERYTGSGPETALYVKSVDSGGPGAAARIAAGERITAVGAKPVSSIVDFMTAMLSVEGKTVPLTVSRGGKAVAVTVSPTIIPKPDGAKLAQSILGVTVQQMDRSLAQSVGIDIDKGILISAIRKNSPAGKAGIEQGDILIQVGDELTADFDSLGTALDAVQDADSVVLRVFRRRGFEYSDFQVRVSIVPLEKS
jgi:serine protease Do